MILFLVMSGPPEGALMRRHAGGIGCGARGREETQPLALGRRRGSAPRPIRAAPQELGHSGADTARLRLRQMREAGAGRTDGSRKARPGAVGKTPAMARHEAPAFSRGSAASNEQWLRHLARQLPRFFRGTRETTADPAPKKIRAMLLAQ